MPHANSRFSRPRAISPSASDGTLPCSAVRSAAEVLSVGLDEVPDAEHDVGPLGQRGRAPGREGGLGLGHDSGDLIDRCEVDVLRDRPRGGVVDGALATGRAGDGGTADPMADPSGRRGVGVLVARFCDLCHGVRTLVVRSPHDTPSGRGRVATRTPPDALGPPGRLRVQPRHIAPVRDRGGRSRTRRGRHIRDQNRRRLLAGSCLAATTAAVPPAMDAAGTSVMDAEGTSATTSTGVSGSASTGTRRPRTTRTTRATTHPDAIAIATSPPALRPPATVGSRHVVETMARATAHRPIPRKKTLPSRRRNAPSISTTVSTVRIARVAMPSNAWDGSDWQGRQERSPRPGPEVRGRPVAGVRLPLAGPGQDHRQLPDTEHEQGRRHRDVQPPADRRTEKARDVAPGDEPADHREAELEPADRRIEQDVRCRAVRAGMQDEVAEPPADDRAGHDPDGHEHHVVRPEAAAPRQDAGQDEGGHDRPDEGDGPPTDDQVAEQLGGWIELERQDGDRHGGGECIEGAPVGLPTCTVSARTSPVAATPDIIASNADGAGDTRPPRQGRLGRSCRDPRVRPGGRAGRATQIG